MKYLIPLSMSVFDVTCLKYLIRLLAYHLVQTYHQVSLMFSWNQHVVRIKQSDILLKAQIISTYYLQQFQGSNEFP